MADANQTSEGAEQSAFLPVGVLDTQCGTPSAVVRANVAANMLRPLTRLHQLPDYGKYKTEPIAIVGGGPSLRKTLAELQQFNTVMVCGSAHDYVARLVRIRYSVLCDADPSEADFLHVVEPSCRYFVASMCDSTVFDALAGRDVVLWHSYQGDDTFGDETRHAIMGGCTVTLRATNIAIMLGYLGEHHYFGFDSSFDDESEYAYGGNPQNGAKITVRSGGREFQSTPGWLAQATHFREMCLKMGHLFTPIVHGDGLIANMMKVC